MLPPRRSTPTRLARGAEAAEERHADGGRRLVWRSHPTDGTIFVMASTTPYDAVVLLSFGGPERPEDVMPFLERVTAGRGVPRERLEEVAEHYHHFGGRSPINDHNRALLGELRAELDRCGIDLPLYWGNRNWHPLLADTVAEMARDGVRRAVAFATSAWSSYSSCRQYQENIADARAAVGERAPVIDKIRPFANHPGFVEAQADRLRQHLARLDPAAAKQVHLAFTAHSIPIAMANHCDYEAQLADAARLVVERLGTPHPFEVVYQSRSGPPQVPWLEPDIVDHLDTLAHQGVRTVVAVPIGFVSDHLEVLYDLDTEAAQRAEQLGLDYHRVPTVGTHPRFVAMIRELVVERIALAAGEHPVRLALGDHGPRPDPCPPGCCPPPPRRPARAPSPTD